jgi:uncharacterized membrane protein
MPQLVAITFEDQASAGEVLRRVRQLEREGQIGLTDTAVLEKDAEGKIHAKNELDSGVETGAVVGGMLGVMLTFFFPIAGLAAGVAGGALVGRMVEQGVDKQLVNDVSAELKPGTSALFLMVKDGSSPQSIQAVQGFKGKVYQTSISTDAEESLRRVLGERT